MSFKDHFSRLAAEYATFRPTYPVELFDYLAGICRAHELAWDCACGSGQASVPLAERFHAVMATDASPAQIERAPRHSRVTYRVAPAEASGLDASSVDLVAVAQALHWFDLPAFYAEVDRVLKPGGTLAVWCYGIVHALDHRLDGLLQRFYRQTVGPYWPPERVHVEMGYRDLAFPYAELPAPALQMAVLWELPQLLGYLRSWSATGRYVAEVGADPVAALEEEFGRKGTAAVPMEVRWPLALRVGRKRVNAL